MTPPALIQNSFGQNIHVGAVVGWGHRDGNLSAHQVGIVLSILPYEGRVWDYDSRSYIERTQYKVKCYWVAGGNKQGYSSTTEAAGLFALDEFTFDDLLCQKIRMARRSQLPS